MELNLVGSLGALAASMILGLVAAWAGLVVGGARRNAVEIPDEGKDI